MKCQMRRRRQAQGSMPHPSREWEGGVSGVDIGNGMDQQKAEISEERKRRRLVPMPCHDASAATKVQIPVFPRKQSSPESSLL